MPRIIGFAGGAFLNVNQDEDLVEVPDVVGDDEASGTSTLEGEGFTVNVTTDYSATVAAGDIISQSPIAGSQAVAGSTVTIVVSLGPAEGAGGCIALFRRRRRR